MKILYSVKISTFTVYHFGEKNQSTHCQNSSAGVLVLTDVALPLAFLAAAISLTKVAMVVPSGDRPSVTLAVTLAVPLTRPRLTPLRWTQCSVFQSLLQSDQGSWRVVKDMAM